MTPPTVTRPPLASTPPPTPPTQAPVPHDGSPGDTVVLDGQPAAPEQQMATMGRRHRVQASAGPPSAGPAAGFVRQWDSANIGRRQDIVSRTMLNPRTLVNGDPHQGLPGMDPSTVRELAETPHPMSPRIRQRLLEGTASPIERALQQRSSAIFQQDTQDAAQQGRMASQALQLRENQSRHPGHTPDGRGVSESQLRATVESGQRAERQMQVLQAQALATDQRWVGRVDRGALDDQLQQTLQDPEVRQRMTQAISRSVQELSPSERTRLAAEQREYLNGEGFQRRLALFPADQREAQIAIESARLALLDPTQAQPEGSTPTARPSVDILGRPAREWMDRVGMLPHTGVGAISGGFAIADSLVRATSANDGSAGWHAASAGVNVLGVGALLLRGPWGLAAQGALAAAGTYVDSNTRQRQEQGLLSSLGVLR